MKILFVASEATPYAASGGLGDVMGALPKSIVEDNPSAEVGVVVPLYDTMKSEYREKLEKVADISFRYSWRNTGASVYKLENSGVNYYLSRIITISTEVAFTVSSTMRRDSHSSRLP